MDGSNRIKFFWWERAKLDKFMWNDLATLNTEITRQHFPEGGALLDLGCGDGSSSGGFPGVLVDFVRPKGLKLADGQRFVESDLRTFDTDERFDVVTLYGVATYLEENAVARLYHRCYAWMKPTGVMLIKHQCGKGADVAFNGNSPELGEYAAFYLSTDKHVKMLRQAGFDVEIVNPHPERNRWDNTEFKLFVCRRPAITTYASVFSDERKAEQNADWKAMFARRRGRSGDARSKLELLAAVKAHLDSHDIPFHLMFGTLLGAVRAGDFIPWDTDVDIAILDRFQGRLIGSLDSCALKMLRAGQYYCTLGHKDDYIDIYTYVDEGDKYSYCGGISRFFDEPKNVFDDWSEIDFRGIRCRTVRSPESSLARWYGADWRIPNRKFVRQQL